MSFWALLQDNLQLDIGRRGRGMSERVSHMQIMRKDMRVHYNIFLLSFDNFHNKKF